MINFFKKKQTAKYSRYIDRMDAQDYIDSTRKYLDYVERHLQNVAKAFSELTDACDGKEHWVGDDFTWYTFRREVEMHDLSKLSKNELVQYRDYFYPVKELDKTNSDFFKAWEHHKKENHHHHETVKNYMDVVHMVIDYMAMSYEFGGCPFDYYKSIKHKIRFKSEFHDYAEKLFKHLIEYRKTKGGK